MIIYRHFSIRKKCSLTGTTNVSANKNWGLKRNEPHALVNELKPEIIVRDMKMKMENTLLAVIEKKYMRHMMKCLNSLVIKRKSV